MAPKVSSNPNIAMDYDRAKEVRAFDETKAGVKGLLDSGVQKVPRIFIRPSDQLEAEKLNESHIDYRVPVIDLNVIGTRDGREKIVEQVLDASQDWGFFQVVNHGIPLGILDGVISGIREFHEQDAEAKKTIYTRDKMKRVRYECNYDLHQSQTTDWRDTLNVSMFFSDQIDADEIPQVCRSSIMDYIKHVTDLGHILLELLSEALGLEPEYLNSIECSKGKSFVFHYYPPCPEPNLTLGASQHTDPSFITAVLQDQLGGLQILHENQWVNVQPTIGGIVVNIGDILQIVSNNKFKSVKHRVISNQTGTRISTAGFFIGPMASPRLYGPIKQLLSEQNPPLFKDFTIGEFIAKFYSRPLDTSGVDLFKL